MATTEKKKRWGAIRKKGKEIGDTASIAAGGAAREPLSRVAERNAETMLAMKQLMQDSPPRTAFHNEYLVLYKDAEGKFHPWVLTTAEYEFVKANRVDFSGTLDIITLERLLQVQGEERTRALRSLIPTGTDPEAQRSLPEGSSDST